MQLRNNLSNLKDYFLTNSDLHINAFDCITIIVHTHNIRPARFILLTSPELQGHTNLLLKTSHRRQFTPYNI